MKATIMRNREGCAGGGKGPMLADELSFTLATSNDQILFDMKKVFAIQANMVDRADTAGCNGAGFNGGPSYTLTKNDKHAVAIIQDMKKEPISFDLAQITSKANQTTVKEGEPVSTLSQSGQMHVGIPEISPPLMSGGNTESSHGARSAMSKDACLIPIVAPCLKGNQGKNSDAAMESQSLIPEISHGLKADGFDASEDGTGRGTPLVPVKEDVWNQTCGCGHRFTGTLSQPCPGCGKIREGYTHGDPLIPEVCGTLSDGAHNGGDSTDRTPTPDELSRCLNAGAMGRKDWETETFIPTSQGGFFSYAVRRLTPKECERLQGFPDDYTLIQFRGKPAKDGNRYKALGNSMAVPVMKWIGQRIEMADKL